MQVIIFLHPHFFSFKVVKPRFKHELMVNRFIRLKVIQFVTHIQSIRTGGYLGQVGLESVPGVGGLLDSLVEGHVNRVPLLPHLVGARVEHALDLVPHLLGGGPLALGSLDVVVAELGPALWHGDAV